MKIRILSIACVATAAALLAACTAVYKNSDACEQLMRSKLAETSSDTLKIAHTGAGIDGSRVVVEGAIEHVMTPSEVAAASAASAAAAASAASAAKVAHAPRAASGALAASAAAAVSGASGVAGASASVAAPAVSASGAEAASFKHAKPKKVVTAAAAECTFHGSALSVFSWLAPASLAAPPDEGASEAAE
ncbi:hypothetical protein [Paraburkholderia lacunae]|uniref:Lipoprotein n=1 Tax=Paraburkholderia lacunae TaxID=2211104 RepID=A0A370MY89_9BURK|nr:hypothetical protein [Paraburkholderia lacunae]RDJ98340.1 hypothetical protein DLM46_34085 [Paraburkholderia lacunae]